MWIGSPVPRMLRPIASALAVNADLADWAPKLDDHGLIWAPMVDLTQVVADPQLRQLNAFEPLELPNGTFETVGVPFTIHGADIRARGAASQPGEDTADALEAAGLSEEEVAEFAANGVFG